MSNIIRPAAAILLLFFYAVSIAQPVKHKTAKPAPVKKIDYEKLKAEIRSLYRDEKHAAVITKAAQYLLKFPGDTAVTVQKAISYVSLKQYPAGFGILKKFYRNIDTAAKYIAFIGFSVPEKDILTSGVACADEAIKITPNSPYGYFVKGGIYSDAGEHEQALPHMEKMFGYCRDDFEKKTLAHFYPKELAFNKQYEKALTVINDLNTKHPKEKEIIFTYSIVHRLNESYDKAIAKYDELSALYPNELEYQSLKVTAFAAWGKATEACAEAELLIAKDSTYDFMRYRYKCPAYFATPGINNVKKATWEVNANGAVYDFIVSNVAGTTDTDFEFDWAMSNKDETKGHIKITKEAMEKAIAQNNYFGSALKNATLTDKTTVWISKAVFNELIKTGSSKMDVGNGDEIFAVVADNIDDRDKAPFDYNVQVNGSDKFLNTMHVTNEDGSRQLWILRDAKNPMIIKMDLGWSIILKSIE